MKKRFAMGFRRLLAWVGCVLMLTGQFALPAAAMSDPSALPIVTLYYSVDEGIIQSMSVAPTQEGESVVYWAQLPQQAFHFPITMDILSMNELYSYTPAEPGTPVANIPMVDLSVPSETIYAYLDGAQVAAYPLFISDIPMPAPQETSAWVTVIYQVDGEQPFHTEDILCESGQTISMRPEVAQGYELISAKDVTVTVDQWGSATPAVVTFLFSAPKPAAKNGFVRLYYLDQENREIAEMETKELTPGEHNISYSYVPAGYTPDYDEPASYKVIVSEQGEVNLTDLIFFFKPDGSSEPEITPEPEVTQPPVTEPEITQPPVTEPEPEVTEPEATQPDDQVITEEIGRYGMTNAVVNFRTEPNINSKKAFENVNSKTHAWAIGTLTVSGEEWVKISHKNTECYVKAEFFDILSQAESDAYVLEQSSVKVPVDYVDANNVNIVLFTQTVPCPKDANTDVLADLGDLPGYTLLGSDRVTVSVSADGKAIPDRVTFAVQKDAAKGYLTVRYLDEEGAEIANTQTQELLQGTHSVEPSASIPEGYTLVGPKAISVTVDASGEADPSEIAFTYAAPQKKPAKGTFTLRHMDTDNQNLLEPQTVEKEEGTHIISPSAGIPADYTLISPQSVEVTISESGAASPQEVVFTYEAPRKTAEGKVVIEYKDTLGATIATAEERPLVEGENDISPNTLVIPQGYQLRTGDPTVVPVTLHEDGRVDPSVVTFVYEAPRQSAQVLVKYTNEIGEELASKTLEFSAAGTYPVAVDTAMIPSGYELNPTTEKSVSVQVDTQLNPTPAQIVFACQVPVSPAKVIVNYVLKEDNRILASEELSLAPGTREGISPKVLKELEGYSLAEGSVLYVEVSVSAQGVASPNAVTFYYKQTEPNQYEGYGVTNTRAALRYEATLEDKSITTTLDQGTLLYVKRQFDANGVRWSEVQMVLGKNLLSGFVQDSQIRRITPAEADAMIEQYKKDNAEPTPTPWVSPAQVTGYYMTIMTSVPLREVADNYANIHSWLPVDTVVYVNGQVFPEQVTWHVATHGGYTGYIRGDQLRKMTSQEEQSYKDSQTPNTPAPGNSPAPYDPQAKSSYGYITSNSVNFRQTPNGSKIKALNRYALTLIYGSQVVNGVTWYNVNQGGTLGWVHGDYLHVMTLTEFNSFINSNEYYQGLTNNSTSSGSSGTGTNNSGGSTSSGTSNSSGSSSQGNVSSVEDWNVGAWQNTGGGLNASYEPFDPNATPAPVEGASIGPEGSTTVEPTATFVIGTMIPINYEDETKETQSSSSPWGLIAAGVVLVGGAGGVYAYALNQNNKRKAAARAAAASRRTGQAGAAGAGLGAAGAAANRQNAQQPYTRRAVAAPPVTGSSQQQSGQGNAQSLFTPQSNATANPQSPFAPPTGPASSTPGTTPPGTSSPGTATPSASTNPYARPILPPSDPETATPPVQNPFVKPLDPPASPSAQAQTGDAPANQPRRSSRTQRYQQTEGDDPGTTSQDS